MKAAPRVAAVLATVVATAGSCRRGRPRRGPFAQLTWERVTLGGYWFNPRSSEQASVGMIGVTF